jgi:hypothetical protein
MKDIILLKPGVIVRNLGASVKHQTSMVIGKNVDLILNECQKFMVLLDTYNVNEETHHALTIIASGPRLMIKSVL